MRKVTTTEDRRPATAVRRLIEALFIVAIVFSWINACKVTVYGQTPSGTPSSVVGSPSPVATSRSCTSLAVVDPTDELKMQEQMLDELRCWRSVGPALQTQVATQQEQIKTLTELAATYKERGDFYKEATTSRAGANVLEAERDRIRREQIEEYRAEVSRLRLENDSLRRSRDRRTLIAFGAGAAAGIFGKH